MTKQRKRLKTLTKACLIIAAFMVAANFALGVVLVIASHNSIKKMNETRMLDISNTAAATIDGDVLRELKKEDADTPAYQSVMDALTVFQDNIDLQYIYCIQKTADGFTFSVDPTVADPGVFGEPVVTTKALETAWNGTPAVDQKPYKDDWGVFYSAYSPVYDSEGNVAGVVAVDFSVEQYEKSIQRNLYVVAGLSVLALLGGAAIVYIVTSRLRERFNNLSDNLSTLSDNIDELNAQIVANPNYEEIVKERAQQEEETASSKDEIGKLNAKIDAMQRDLQTYLDYIRNAAYTDAMTGVNNKSAYLEVVEELQKQIERGTATFSVAVFDINLLKEMNDNHGHAYGDKMICASASVMAGVFGRDRVYRIGGDEFIAVVEGATKEDMKAYFDAIDVALAKLHEDEKMKDADFCKGAATFGEEDDHEYNSVFKRADTRMYKQKVAYHKGRKNGSSDPRR